MTTSRSAMPEAIATLIEPRRLQTIFELAIPWPKDNPPNGKDWVDCHNNFFMKKELFWEPLVAISKLDVDSMPSFMHLLPEPSSQEFPAQALGLLFLLDQAPRYICTGANERWRNGFFDVLALGLSLELRNLPLHLRINKFKRWEECGFSYAHWCVIAVLVTAPLTHAEDLYIHENLLLPEVHEYRKETERYYNIIDAYHAKELSECLTLDASSDTLAFSRFARDGLPDTENIHDIVFWFCRVKEAHIPIIRIFGRYPYRYRAMGRDNSEMEKEFLEKTENFGVSVSEEDGKRIKEDVENGVWTALT